MNTTKNNLTFREWNDAFGHGVIAVRGNGFEEGYCPDGEQFAHIPDRWVPNMDLAPMNKPDMEAWQIEIASAYQNQTTACLA